MKAALVSLLLLVFGIATGWIIRDNYKSQIKSIENVSPLAPIAKPLEKYSIESLSQKSVIPAEIKTGEILEDNKDFTSSVFTMKFDPTLENKELKTVSGVINVPKTGTTFPMVILIRGFVDQTIYTPGMGSKRAAEFFAQNGFVTVAPDFLGYAASDKESSNIFESRFQTYTTMMSLLDSLSSVKEWNGKDLFIWAHSNGGQIALTTLEITGKAIPTVLWAPVTKPFPYSVLYYTDEASDGGKMIRKELAKFEELYDVDGYALTNYLANIKAPLQLNQGTADDAVPVAWSNSIVKQLKENEIDVKYYIYPGADHNLQPGWNTAVERALEFYNSHMEK